MLPISAIETAYYLRLRALDRPGVLADVTRILADQGISIEAMLQRTPPAGEAHVDVIILTHRTVESGMVAALARIEALANIAAPVVRIRMEDLAS